MDEIKRNLKGSEKCDLFKRKHKDLHRSYYASDVDLCLISKFPPGVVAYLDYKTTSDCVTFSEVILYNELIITKPVYIIIGDDPENGPFEIKRYLGGDWNPDPPLVDLQYIGTVKTWGEFALWESKLRSWYTKRIGDGG